MKFGKVIAGVMLIGGVAIGGYTMMHQGAPSKSQSTTDKASVTHRKLDATSQKREKQYPVKVDPNSDDAIVLMVVNKKHPLPADYNPYSGGLSPKTEVAKNQLIAAMKKAGLSVGDTVSGFRSYDYQKTLYDGYVANQGQAEADTVSARPGYSEHQTGLAFDLRGADGNLFAEGGSDPAAAKWLVDNSYKYGLIVRYPKNLTSSTGYSNEEWHMRYVGEKAAEVIMKNNITLEQYTGNAGGDYNANKADDIPALEEYTAKYADKLAK